MPADSRVEALVCEDPDSYFAGLAAVVDDVFRAHEDITDHRGRHPWLLGALGDPFAPVWFVAENPSLKQVESIPSIATPEYQWSASAGDRLFQEALAACGLKQRPFEPGGWKCYITDVVKDADYAGVWRRRPKRERLAVAEAWAPALAYELKQGAPRVLIVLGEAANDLLDHLERTRLLPTLPPRRQIHHYTYVAMRPESGGLRRRRNHPDRVAEWYAAIADTVNEFADRS